MKCNVTAYIAHGMSNRNWKEVYAESVECTNVLSIYGIKTVDPVNIEEISDKTIPIPIRIDETGKQAWSEDKRAIRDCHILIDITPHLKSEGVAHEIGLMRYAYWKPVVRILQKGKQKPMIPYFEDDMLVYSLQEAAELINEKYGTWWKRFKWRINMYKHSRIKALINELRFWFQ